MIFSKDNLDLDIGMGPMENCWADKGKDAEAEAEVVALKQHLGEDIVFIGIKYAV